MKPLSNPVYMYITAATILTVVIVVANRQDTIRLENALREIVREELHAARSE